MSADEQSPPLPTTWPSDPAERGRAMAAAGVIGGRRPGAGRPRRDRFSRLLAEEMAEHVDEVVDALRAGLKDPNTRTRVQAARAAVDLAVRHDGVAQRDQHHDDARDRFDAMTSDELRRAFAAEVAGMIRAGELSAEDVLGAMPGLDVVEVEAVEDQTGLDLPALAPRATRPEGP